jgi:hypothetical protein
MKRRQYEIHWNREKEQFEMLDTEAAPDFILITTGQARERWDACDADWSMGAFDRMSRIAMGQEGVV